MADIEDFDDWPDDADDDADIDVCQHCGGYFAWTASLRAAWIRTWNPDPDERQPQRCYRCVVDETWIEAESDA